MAAINTGLQKSISIVNFKSIKHIKIEPARVNVFIGKPNAGKSNLIEALTFLGLDIHKNEALPHDQIRYTDVASLFFHHNTDESIFVAGESIIENIKCSLSLTDGEFRYTYSGSVKKNNAARYSIQFPKAKVESNGFFDDIIEKENNIKKYHFSKIIANQNDKPKTAALNYSGDNLWHIVSQNSKLKEFAATFFKEFSLDVLYDTKSKKMDIMHRQGDSYYLIDFSMTPDTFQRMLYYLAAIESNKNAVLLLEEPEAQSYPPYIQMLAERIIDDKENQYFITTHSPFIVEKMMERAGTEDDVKIFITYFEDYQTRVHELSKKEIDHILDNNIDLFFNMEAFQKA
jgi:AAA15 family ATPase/GTPase